MTLRYMRAPEVLQRRAFESILLLPRRASVPVLLAGSGTMVWGLLETPIALDELCDVLSDATGAPSSTVRADVEPLLETLTDQGLVETVA